MAISDCKVPEYQKASWKGVAFNVESSSDEFGRRGDLYEYPLSERTAYKDMGRKAHRFRVEGYLIGGEQVALTQRMKQAAESAEPGTLIHPMYGSQRVACVTLTASADYKKDKRRTKLNFEFIEANESMSPFKVGDKLPSDVDAKGSAAAEESKNFDFGSDTSRTNADQMSNTFNDRFNAINGNLSTQAKPATDEISFDAVDKLNGNASFNAGADNTPNATGGFKVAATLDEGAPVIQLNISPRTFREMVDPIDDGTATIRRIHNDALVRLREFNRFVVGQSNGDPDVEALIVTTRLALIRDFAVKSSLTKYKTIRDALSDLDFIMSVYDDEEAAATQRCHDALVTAIRDARATAAQAILSANIRLPGVVISSVDGVWPSVVAAHKIYFDARRYIDVERYNAQMPPFFIGRDVVSPAASDGVQ